MDCLVDQYIHPMNIQWYWIEYRTDIPVLNYVYFCPSADPLLRSIKYSLDNYVVIQGLSEAVGSLDSIVY